MFEELTTKEKEFLTFMIVGDICGVNDDEHFHESLSLYYWARLAGLSTIPPEPRKINSDYFYPKELVAQYHNTDWSDDQVFSGEALTEAEYEALLSKLRKLSDQETEELKEKLTAHLEATKPVYYPPFAFLIL